MGDPTGAPRTVSPWCVAGRLGLPTQTSGPNEAVFGGSAPAAFHTRVLPWFRWMRAWW